MTEDSPVQTTKIPQDNQLLIKYVLLVLLFVFLFPVGVIVMWLWLKKWPFFAKLIITLLPIFMGITFSPLITFMVNFQSERSTLELQDRIKQQDKIIKAFSNRSEEPPLTTTPPPVRL